MAEADEIAALDRILTRLALLEDEKLEETLSKLLPLVIEKLSTNSAGVRGKVLELLGHVNKRVKAARALRLPLLPLVRLATGAAAPMVRSFALVYTETAVDRAQRDDLIAALPLLLDGISGRAAQHAAIAARCVTAALAALGPAADASASAVTAAASGVAGGPATAHLLPSAPADRARLLEHLTRLLLYQRPVTDKPRTPLAAAAAATAAAATSTAAAAAAQVPPPLPPPGLSPADVAAFEEKGAPDAWELVRRKLGALQLIAGATAGSPVLSSGAGAQGGPPASSAGPPAQEASTAGSDGDVANGEAQSSGAGTQLLTPSEVLIPLLAAACDPSEPVSRRGEALVRRLCGVESARPSVDLEDAELAGRLMAMVTGAAEDGGPQTATAVGPALAARIMQLLVRSVAAAQHFPDNARVLSACLYGPGAPGGSVGPLGAPAGGAAGRLRAQGMEWCVWVIRHAPQNQLKAMAPTLLARLLPATGGVAPAAAASGGGDGGGGDAMQIDAPAAGSSLAATGGGGAQDAAMRGWAYQAVAALAQRLPEHFEGDVDVARRFFGALASEPSGSRAALQEAVGALAGAYASAAAKRRAAGGGDSSAAAVRVEEDLRELLLGALGSDQPAVRLCAIQWFLRLFPPSDAASRYAAALAAGDPKPEIRDAGLRGLALAPGGGGYGPAVGGGAALGGGERAAASGSELLAHLYPSPGALLSIVQKRHPALAAVPDPGRPLPMADRSLEALIAFTACCRLAAAARRLDAAASQASVGAAAMETDRDDDGGGGGFALLLEHAACRAAPRVLMGAALEASAALTAPGGGFVPSAVAAAVSAAVASPSSGPSGRAAAALLQEAAASAGDYDARARAEAAEDRAAARLSWLRELLGHNDGAARTAAARLVGAAAASMLRHGGPAAADQVRELLSSLLHAGCGGVEAGGAGARAGVGAASKLEEREGSVLAAGFVVGQARGVLQAAVMEDAVSRLTALLPSLERQPMLAGAAALALGYVGATGRLPDVLAPAGGEAAPPADAQAQGGAASAASGTDGAVLARLAALLPTAAPIGAGREGGQAAAAALCRVAHALGVGALGEDRPEVLRAVVKALVGLATATKSEELLLVAGESMALAFGGVPLTPQQLLRSPASRLSDLLPAAPGDDEDDAAEGAGAPATPNPTQAAPAAGAEPALWLQGEVLSELQGPLALSSKPEARCAAALWMVSLLAYCREAPALSSQSTLASLQSAFTALLGDANELTQETAARGVSLVYARGGGTLRSQLLSQLVGVLQGNTAGAASISGVKGAALTGDTKLFEEGTLGSVPGGGGLSTYRELASLASDLGQPELIYRFMDLARHASAANASRGAAAGVAGIAKLLGIGRGGGKGAASASGLTALLGADKLSSLLPRLYRQQYDPSPKVSEAMAAIWGSLVDDTRAALDAHFDAIVADLLREMGGRTWKGRQAAAAALGDLLQGRRWDQLGPHITEMWSMTLRTMDDVKESVRRTATATARTLRGTSLRLMDAGQTPSRDVAACCAALLPMFLEKGLPSTVAEVQGLSLDMLTQAVRSAGPAPLAPLAPALVPGLLEALSGLEDARLNYLEQHATRIGGDDAAGALEGARLAAARSSPLSDALDLLARCVAADSTGASAMRLVPELTGLVRRGVGLNTKAGTAHFIRSLAQRGALAPASSEAAAAEPTDSGGVDRTAAAAAPPQRSPVPQLLKALRSAVASERSAGVRKAYAAAAAAVASRSSEKRLSRFIADAVAAYGASPDDADGGGSSSDEGTRLAGALLLRELMRASPDAFNRHASEVLPVAFLGKMDSSSEVAAAWGAVWEEGAPSEAAALRMHAGELAGLLAGGLRASSWGRKVACAEALASMAELAGGALSQHAPALAAVLVPEATAGRLWDGKEKLLAALGALAAACPAALAADPGIAHIVSALLSAAGRRRTAYRSAALAALQKLLTALGDSADKGEAVPGAGEVYAAVSQPLLEAVMRHATEPPAQAKPAALAGSAAASEPAAADEDGPPPPLPLAESLRCLAAAWCVAPPAVRAAGGSALFHALGSVMARPGLPWASWLAAATAADDVLAACAKPGGGGCEVAWLPPLLRGLIHCLTHSTVSQLRQRVLGAMARAISAGEAAASSGAGDGSGGGGAALMAALEAAEQREAAGAAAAVGDGGAASNGGAGEMELDEVPLGAALRGALQGVVDHEPFAALKTSAAALLERIG
ncbi:hypothetical protein Rsub_07814 [Raphidocelis subcapitata]|uniref:Uncharacterized protein n=1 Tax=Raphidocelis subcapitata TaxID=307507 RepID=A0A2V0P6B1_9CHLO|nr:hypothetical protein Rsub_07814 [Raphidocelis subcapitata]|eukprot:GBF95386.1 hypothetical protein Rsub_07814 [Raphidocelis subcapitata]